MKTDGAGGGIDPTFFTEHLPTTPELAILLSGTSFKPGCI